MRIGLVRCTLVVFLCAMTVSAQASWLSKITGIDINIPAGTISFSAPQPGAIPDMLKNLPTDLLEGLNPYGQKLAFLIREAQAQALNGAQPIPPYIRGKLLNFFPAYILDKARWNVYDASRVTLDSLILGSDCSDLHLPFNIDCKMGAITLDHTIVFRGANQAQFNYVAWAHELVHVSQYDSLGVEGFAFIYASPGAYSLEKQAYDWQATVAQAPPTQAYYIVAPGQPMQFTAQAFYQAAAQLAGNRAAPATLDCAAIRGPGTDTGISIQDSNSHFNRGSALQSQGDVSGAIVEYQAAIQSNHTNPAAYDGLGQALLAQGRTGEAVAQLQKAVCYDNQPTYRQHLASVQQGGGSSPTGALGTLQSTVFQNPESVAGRLALAQEFRRNGDADDADVQEWAAAQIAPPDGGSLYADLRSRLNADWAADIDETNPVSNVKSRTHFELRRLDTCVLSWNESSNMLNTGAQTLRSFTYTVNLDQITPDVVTSWGTKINFKPPNKAALTSTLLIQYQYAYQPLNVSHPLFVMLPVGSVAETNSALASILTIISACNH
jgi:tetratricopeptide (TPR) repeat protein